MEVILQKDVEKVGRAGEIVKVRMGFARNFLLPRGLAVLATTRSVRQVEHLRKTAEAKAKRMLRDVQELAKQIEQAEIQLKVKVGDQGKLFGSITSKDLEEALQKTGITVDRKAILLGEPAKSVGAYSADVRLHTDVTAKLKFWVVAE
ncbi:MAG: 50S ribosomal protein L9 [Nitrospirae bacterium]|nr:50S ribosomal protein L9 [Nitrospirota bacterium]